MNFKFYVDNRVDNVIELSAEELAQRYVDWLMEDIVRYSGMIYNRRFELFLSTIGSYENDSEDDLPPRTHLYNCLINAEQRHQDALETAADEHDRAGNPPT